MPRRPGTPGPEPPLADHPLPDVALVSCPDDFLDLAGAPAPDLVASAVASSFVAVLADWLHGLIEGTPDQVAGQVWRLLISLHRTRLP